MSAMLEREVKLAFDSAESARTAVLAAGAQPHRARRLQDDVLLDAAEGAVRDRGQALRVRADGEACILTFKGPVQPGPMKLREEIETAVGDRERLLLVFERLGYRPWFRCQKFREEFLYLGAIIAIDDTPVGVFVEIEGTAESIDRVAAALGRTPSDYIVSSYRALWSDARSRAGLPVGHMLFEPVEPRS